MQSTIIRDAHIKKVQQSLSITDGDIRIYRIYHDGVSSLDGDKDTSLYIYSHIPKDTMHLLVAHILFLGAEVDESFPLIQDDIAELLIQFYDCKVVEEHAANAPMHALELSDLWNNWAGYHEEINEMDLFKREGLLEAIRGMILD
ncbi:hypothetical protein [Paenibacillus taichungensis]|uniref:hypothetical protein n=1 Tax=Paenibacillus taichungensis TaxID=484184 RepID=UPI0035E10999